MTSFADTNLVLRYLTGQPEDHSRRAEALIDGGASLTITDVVLLEAAYILRSQYGVSREDVIDTLVEFVRKENISVHNIDEALVVEALVLCRPSGRVSIGDAMIWAAARSASPSRVYTFYERFPAAGVEITAP